jgi:hypothetical protein
MSAVAAPDPKARASAQKLLRRARWQLLLGRRARAQALCREAVGIADYTSAYRLLSRMSLPGENYFRVLGRLHRHIEPRTYLEIGVARGKSLRLVLPQTRVLGIDPQPALVDPPGANVRIFAETSDEFFTRHDLRAELGGLPLDMAFIDGMHHFEFALRDFINIERLAAPGTVILIHDCYPLDERTALRERLTQFWSGDIWRLMLLLRERRPDLTVRTIATPPTGLGIVLNPDPNSRVLGDELARLIPQYLARDFSVLAGRQPELLGLIENRWPVIRELLDKRRKG